MSEVKVCLALNSSAALPMSFIVEEFQTSFEGRIPRLTTRHDNGGLVDPLGKKIYVDNTIDMQGWALQNEAEGTARFKIRYGSPGREKHIIEKNIRFAATLDATLGTYVSTHYQDKV